MKDKDIENKKISLLFKSIRVLHGLSQKEVAKALNCSERRIYYIEKGNSLPTCVEWAQLVSNDKIQLPMSCLIDGFFDRLEETSEKDISNVGRL